MSRAAVILQAGHLATLPLDKEEGITIKDECIEIAETEYIIVEIGVDGGVIEFYSGFESYMRETFRNIPGIEEAEKKIKLGIAKDGSSVGAAIIALLVAQQSTELRVPYSCCEAVSLLYSFCSEASANIGFHEYFSLFAKIDLFAGKVPVL